MPPYYSKGGVSVIFMDRDDIEDYSYKSDDEEEEEETEEEEKDDE